MPRKTWLADQIFGQRMLKFDLCAMLDIVGNGCLCGCMGAAGVLSLSGCEGCGRRRVREAGLIVRVYVYMCVAVCFSPSGSLKMAGSGAAV